MNYKIDTSTEKIKPTWEKTTVLQKDPQIKNRHICAHHKFTNVSGTQKHL